MATLVLQLAVACMKVAFGTVAARIARGDRRAAGVRRVAWSLTATAFLLSGAGSLGQALWAPLAVAAGPGAPVYDAFLRWTPAMNISRIFVMLAYGALILALPLLRPDRPHRLRLGMALLGAAFLVGAGVGAAQGRFESTSHYTWLSVSEAAELIVLLAALGAALLARSLDWMLWAAILAYAVRQAVNAIFWAAAAWVDSPQVWHPPFWLHQMVAMIAWGVMISLALRRLRLTREGRGVPTLLEEVGPVRRVSTLG